MHLRCLLRWSDLPVELYALQQPDAMLGHGRLAPLEEELVLSSLALDPRGELLVGEGGGHVAGVVLLLVLHQGRVLLAPVGLVRVPDEFDVVEELQALGRHGGRLRALQHLVLPALALDPACQLRVLGVRVGDGGMAVLGEKEFELLVSRRPLLLMEWLEVGHCGVDLFGAAVRFARVIVAAAAAVGGAVDALIVVAVRARLG